MGTQELTAIIIGSMPVVSWDRIAPLVQGKRLVICADGGLLQAEKLGLTPDYYVGDSDSGGTPPEGVAQWLLPAEKDLTDLEMGVEIALKQKATKVILCGCSGGRGDHHLANLLLTERLARQNIPAWLVDGDNLVCCLLPGVHKINGKMPWRYFGLVSLDSRLEGLSLTGCKYPLHRQDIYRGSTLTISNQLLPEQDTEIRFERGTALLIFSQPTE